MHASLVIRPVAFAAAASATLQEASLILDGPPSFVRPYVVPHNQGPVLNLGDTAYRFPVTASSSGGKLTVLTTSGDASAALNVFPHRHIVQYENFFCSRGGVQLWTQQYNGTQNVRKLTAGDFGASPPNVTHTFQIVEANTEMYGVVFDGGLERMFYSLGPNVTYGSLSPYDSSLKPAVGGFGPQAGPGMLLSQAMRRDTSPPPPGGLDLIPNPSFVPRRDITNGSAPASAGWHTAKNTLPSDATQPYYIARDMGPKYLHKDASGYQVIQPLSTALQSAAHNFTLSWITVAQKPANATAKTRRFPGHAGFRVEEGALALEVDGYAPAQLLWGDVAFIPGNTSYRYYSAVAYTKALHFAAGGDGLDTTLISESAVWNSPVWPANY